MVRELPSLPRKARASQPAEYGRIETALVTGAMQAAQVKRVLVVEPGNNLTPSMGTQACPLRIPLR